jgi:hypothetical protein
MLVLAATFKGFVDDAGAFALDNRDAFRDYVQKFKGHEVVVTIKKWSRPKTLQQLRYLRGVVIPDIARACGEADPDCYQDYYEALMFKHRRLPDGPFGTPRRRSAADMNIDEMRLLIDEIILDAETTIVGCRVTRPDEADLESVYDPGWK